MTKFAKGDLVYVIEAPGGGMPRVWRRTVHCVRASGRVSLKSGVGDILSSRVFDRASIDDDATPLLHEYEQMMFVYMADLRDKLHEAHEALTLAASGEVTVAGL